MVMMDFKDYRKLRGGSAQRRGFVLWDESQPAFRQRCGKVGIAGERLSSAIKFLFSQSRSP
jgi:hypothetical protein